MGTIRYISLKNVKNLGLILISSFIILSPFFCCAAAGLDNAFNDVGPLNQVAGDKGAGYNTTVNNGFEDIISLVITTVLSFLGVIFLVLMIYGGFIWMMARGNEQEVEKAKQIIQNSIIGLVVVVAAYAISWYVINVLGGVALQSAK